MRRIFLLGTAAAMLAAAAPSAFAQSDDAVMKRLDQMQKMIEAQQKEIGTLKKALAKKGASLPAPEPVAQPAPPPPAAPPPVIETRLQQQDQKIDDLVAKFAAERDARRLSTQEAAQPSVTNGRLQIASADGRFSAALRATVQY